jgi:flagellar basal-body rod modification protein FlgD
MTNSIDNSILTQLGVGKRAADAPRDKLGQDDFLRLMTTQLTNQDPFKPMDSGQFLGQLAQFGTVSGIADMQKTLQGLSGSLVGNQTLQAASLISRDVLVPSHEGFLKPGSAIAGAIDVADGTRKLSLEVRDLSGQLVTRLPIETDTSGRKTFSWDGTLPGGGVAAPGFYALSAVGDHNGGAVSLDVMVSGRVESVGVGGRDGGVALTVTGLGVVDLSQVKGII